MINRCVDDAGYICPLSLDRTAHRFHSHIAGISHWPLFWHRMPWDIENISINITTGTLNLSSIPVLKEHISIPPHDKVNSAIHSYSFTERGKELCFHSALALTDEINDLSYFFEGIIGNVDNRSLA